MNPLLEATNLTKHFPTRQGLLYAVDGISFTLHKQKTLGIVGESGCGKSTLGRVALRLLDATGGKLAFDGRDITAARGARLKALRREMQMIFQDPYASLDPRETVESAIAEPLRVFNLCESSAGRERQVQAVMDTVGLARRTGRLYPHELDGGRRQRVGIARALALNPRLIVCDEPVSALDVSIQAQILNLLRELQRERGLAYLFISHNLSVVRHVSDDVMVMYLGVAVERCAARELFERPLHPYSKALLSAIPEPTLHKTRERVILRGEITSPIGPGEGCRFAPRCPEVMERCRMQTPPFTEVTAGHWAACHR